MRILLISDTHGKLDIINELATRTRADAVIHAGDFGFYDDSSYERLSERELELHVRHSDLPTIEKKKILALPCAERIQEMKDQCPLNDFSSYVCAEKQFEVPVYAVWGNHEDKALVDSLFRGKTRVNNLFVLHHRVTYLVGPVLVFGIGGNFLPGSKFLQRPIAGGAGKIWSTLAQYTDLIEKVDAEKNHSGPRIFVSHVSPGKEPFVETIAARTAANFTVSGHMGAPTCMVWNPFAVSSAEEATRRLCDALERTHQTSLDKPAAHREAIDQSFDLIGRHLSQEIHERARKTEPRWYRGMTHINLPDAHVGFAVLEIDDSGSLDFTCRVTTHCIEQKSRKS